MWRSRWLSGVGVVVLIGGLILANYDGGVTPASATGNYKPPPNPFTEILKKLDEILDKLMNGSGAGNHTLRWDTNNPSASRFVTAFIGAVLDKNTGLVWEQAPDATTRTWPAATSYCANKPVGGTVGWRAPSVIELKSVQDPSLAAPFVPASVFTGVQSSGYWSASSIAGEPTSAWAVSFGDGVVGNGVKAAAGPVWCVRGPMQESVY